MEATLGRRLRDARRGRELTQAQLAKMVNLTQPVISALECDYVAFPGYVRRVATALGLNADDLL
jgi:transcriptional regulator with XRE-family HTH domain